MLLDKNLINEIKPYRCRFIKIFSLQIGSVLCTIAFAFYLAQIIAAVFLNQAILAEVVPLITVLLFIIGSKLILRCLAETIAQETSKQIQAKLRLSLITNIFAKGPIALAAEQTGTLIACINTGINELDEYFTKFLPQCIAVITILPIIFITALSADFLTAIIFMLTAPLIPIFMLLIGKRTEVANNRQWKTMQHLSARFLDLLEGLTTLKIFNQSQRQSATIGKLSDDFRRSTLQVLRIAFLSAFVLELIATLSIAITAVSLGLRLLDGQMLFVQAFFLLLLAPEFYQPLRQLGGAFHSAMAATTAAATIYHWLKSPSLIPALGKTNPAPKSPPTLIFTNVNYTYQADRLVALNSLNFTVNAGEHVAIVGSSGVGKSTIFQLLLQFAQPSAGEIYLNQHKLSTIAPADLRQQIAYLPQAPHIFAMTAAENIRLAKNNADDAAIISAAKHAQIHEFILSLPNGYQTMLGAGGYKLSGGQKQRIAIARAFLQDAPLILLDEAMRGLDNETERSIEASLTTLARGKTMLIITHRLHLANLADKIIVLANGTVQETGSHQELLAKQGLYFSLATADWRLA